MMFEHTDTEHAPWHIVQDLVEKLVEQALRQARGDIASARVRLNTAILAHVLPKIALVFVAAELHAFEVAAGNDAQDLAGPDQWNVAQAAIPRQAQRGRFDQWISPSAGARTLSLDPSQGAGYGWND
jgi:hypothetical protein